MLSAFFCVYGSTTPEQAQQEQDQDPLFSGEVKGGVGVSE
jgi:hypothetical protein